MIDCKTCELYKTCRARKKHNDKRDDCWAYKKARETKHDFKKDDPIEAVKMPRGKQTIPAGTKGIVVQVHPQEQGLLWVKTDEPVLAKSGKNQDFWVCPEEIKKI